MKETVSNEICIQRLVVNEGLKLKPYYCPAGHLTIGIGRNLEANPLTTEEKAVYAEYRQYLRDYTNGENWWLENPKTYEEWNN